MAATVEVVVPQGVVRPVVPVEVHVAGVDEGRGLEARPPFRVEGGSAEPVPGDIGQGVWAWSLRPESGVDQVRVQVEAFGRIWTQLLAVQPPPPLRLEVPERVSAAVGEDRIRLSVSGEDLPAPEDLRVVVGGGGSVHSVVAMGGALEVTVDPGPGTAARFVPVGLWVEGADAAPLWTGVRMRARMELSYATEPGTRLELSVGPRTYGPFLADEEGVVRGYIDHYPGEAIAEAVFTDALGNFTKAPLPLTGSAAASLVPMVTRRRRGGRAPVVYLRGTHGTGQPWDGRPPTCRTPVGMADVVPVEPGTWSLALPRDPEPGDLRVECDLGRAAGVEFRVQAAPDAPERLRMRVWPDELDADFPVAEVQVVLEDARGERLPVEGVTLSADLGEVVTEVAEVQVLRGEYRGDAALGDTGVSVDVVRATYALPPGRGRVAGLQLGHGAVPLRGPLVVHGRALDARGRPLEGVELVLGAGAGTETSTTGTDGWASAEVQVPLRQSPVMLEGRTGAVIRRGLAMRGAPSWSGPGLPDLQDSHAVRIAHGRVSEISIRVPSVLVTGSRAATHLRVVLLDRAGKPIDDTWPAVEVDHGSLGGMRLDDDGTFVVLYTPPTGDRPQTATFTARAEGRSATAQLQLQVRPVSRAPGLSAGVISNFGAITSPYFSADIDLRTALVAHSIMVRIGVAWYSGSSESTTAAGTVRARGAFLPITLGLAARRDPGRASQWLGAGLVLAPMREETWYDGDRVAGLGVLPPGFTVFAGAGWRVPGGELFAEARVLSLTHPGGEGSLRGLVGGLGAVLGYRVPF